MGSWAEKWEYWYSDTVWVCKRTNEESTTETEHLLGIFSIQISHLPHPTALLAPSLTLYICTLILPASLSLVQLISPHTSQWTSSWTLVSILSLSTITSASASSAPSITSGPGSPSSPAPPPSASGRSEPPPPPPPPPPSPNYHRRRRHFLPPLPSPTPPLPLTPSANHHSNHSLRRSTLTTEWREASSLLTTFATILIAIASVRRRRKRHRHRHHRHRRLRRQMSGGRVGTCCWRWDWGRVRVVGTCTSTWRSLTATLLGCGILLPLFLPWLWNRPSPLPLLVPSSVSFPRNLGYYETILFPLTHNYLHMYMYILYITLMPLIWQSFSMTLQIQMFNFESFIPHCSNINCKQLLHDENSSHHTLKL